MKVRSIQIFLLFVFAALGLSGWVARPALPQQPSQPPQKERFVRPYDEAAKDHSFKTFRNDLIRAVRARDRGRLIAVLDKNILNSFGGNGGIEEFKTMWRLESADSEVWDKLLAVLTKGGRFTGKGADRVFCAPYLYTDFPEDLDAFEHRAIYGSGVNLREKPNLYANVITQLSHNIVTVDFENSVSTTTDANRYVWLKIETLGGRTGYVSADLVRSPIDYRACFAKEAGRWKMMVFVAGD